MKALLGTFKQEKALVGAWSFPGHCETLQRFVNSSDTFHPMCEVIASVSNTCDSGRLEDCGWSLASGALQQIHISDDMKKCGT